MWLHRRTHLLIRWAVPQFRHPLVPERKAGCFATRITVRIDRIVESGMDKVVAELLLAVLARSGTLLPIHDSISPS